jgi:hypothetical protein
MYGDVRSVTVQVLIRVLRDSLAPLGPSLELDVVDVDSAKGGEASMQLGHEEAQASQRHWFERLQSLRNRAHVSMM